MPAYIQGVERSQRLLLPEAVEDYVSPNDHVRFLDAFVDGLDMAKLGFRERKEKNNGRPSYSPQSMTKLLLWGYLNRCRSSRELEKACYDRLGVIWLTGKITPDHSTIAEFRKTNAKNLTKLLKEFNVLCLDLGMFSREMAAIDGAFMEAVNNRFKYLSKAKIKGLEKKIDGLIEHYLEQLESREDDGPDAPEDECVKEKIEQLKERKRELGEKAKQCEESPTGSLCETDTEVRPLTKGGKTVVGYNLQIAVDSKHHLVVCSDIVEAANDRKQLHHMSMQAKEALGMGEEEALKVAGDTGYGTASEVALNDGAGIESHVLFQKTSQETGKYYSHEDFTHHADTDELECPGKRRLKRLSNRTDAKSGTEYKVYGASSRDCRDCALKRLCTKKDRRKVSINVDQDAADRSMARCREHPEVIGKRSSIGEHPFGTLKRVFLALGLSCYGKEMAKAETSLGCLCYNIRRVLSHMEVVELLNFMKNRVHAKAA